MNESIYKLSCSSNIHVVAIIIFGDLLKVIFLEISDLTKGESFK